MKTQIFFNKDLFACLNVHDIAMWSFPLNDEIVSPQMNEEQYQAFMRDNSQLTLNDMGELIHAKLGKVATVLEYRTFKRG